MARRAGGNTPPIADQHLWEEVAATVAPLRRRAPRRSGSKPLPLPPAEPPAPAVPALAMPSYQSPGTPGAPASHRGIEPKLRRKVGRGRVEIDGTLDLHGMRRAEARAALGRYLAARVRRGDRTILVITGKGLKKVDGDPATIVERGVLRTMLPIWLGSPELSPLVAGWDVSHQTHGGEGAYYVRLKRLERLA
jgi:DNA-nicking Smr family endonuclease